MSNVGKGPNGYVFTASGEGSNAGGKFVEIGTSSGLTDHGVVISHGTSAFTSTAPGSSGNVLASNGLDWVSTPVSGVITFPISLSQGGTNASLTANIGGIFYSTATAGAILSGTATAGQVLQSGASAAPSWSTATYPATAGSSGNVMTSDGTNFVSSTPTGGGLIWSEITGTSQNAEVGHGYVPNNAGLVTITLPANFALGDTIIIQGLGAGLWSIVANTGDVINFGSSPTSAGGSLTATNRYDAVLVRGISANSVWAANGLQGNLTVA